MYWEKTELLPKISTYQDVLLVYGTFSPDDLKTSSLILTPEELLTADKLKHQEQKNTWISCHMVLRRMLAEFLKMDPLKVEINRNRFGRPYLQDSSLFFNISHTNSAFLLGFIQGGKIGVDLENLSGNEDLPSLIDYAFSDAEAGYCKNSEEIAARFLELWTLKEAFLKYTGIGLTNYLSAINIYGSEENDLMSFNLNYNTFLCPNNETCSIVYSSNKSLNCNWLC